MLKSKKIDLNVLKIVQPIFNNTLEWICSVRIFSLTNNIVAIYGNNVYFQGKEIQKMLS